VNTDAPRAGLTRRVRVFHYCSWAEGLEDATAFVARLPALKLGGKVSDPNDPRLLKMARLDCDWHGENARAFGAMEHPDLTFLPAQVLGSTGMLAFAQASQKRPPDETWWLIFMGQHPQALAGTWSRLGPILKRNGVSLLFYAFDEASRTMPCFPELAPHLDILIHDESPLDARGAAYLRPKCLQVHRSWVANLVPYAVPFQENPERALLFLGSQLGLTPHRQRQIDFLQATFKDRFHAIHDHSLAVADRARANQRKASLCPEGRKFATPAMSATHTDRPFWSGCLGMVPVCEDSVEGCRLESLHRSGMILRYAHGDLPGLRDACERALEMDDSARRVIYDWFNREETVGRVVAPLIAAHLSES